MQTVFSKLEDNYAQGVLIKKGESKITDKDYEILKKSKVFNSYVKANLITVLSVSGTPQTSHSEASLCHSEALAKESQNETAPDFSSMSYLELKAYVKENKIEVPSMKKEDILNILKK